MVRIALSAPSQPGTGALRPNQLPWLRPLTSCDISPSPINFQPGDDQVVSGGIGFETVVTLVARRSRYFLAVINMLDITRGQQADWMTWQLHHKDLFYQCVQRTPHATHAASGTVWYSCGESSCNYWQGIKGCYLTKSNNMTLELSLPLLPCHEFIIDLDI